MVRTESGAQKPRFTERYGRKGALHKARDRIFVSKNRLGVIIPQRMKKIAVMQTAGQYIEDPGRNVGDQANPGNARATTARIYNTGKLIDIQEARKIDTSMCSQRVITPSAGIDVQ